jgi:hypothetical protein
MITLRKRGCLTAAAFALAGSKQVCMGQGDLLSPWTCAGALAITALGGGLFWAALQ